MLTNGAIGEYKEMKKKKIRHNEHTAWMNGMQGIRVSFEVITSTAGSIRSDYLVGTFRSFSFVGWMDRPTDRHFDVIYELALTVS